MLTNPFTPSEIASHPEDFFGRAHELRMLERSIKQGSVAISGAIGIGKSSLLSRTRLLMEGFGSDHRALSVVAVGDKDVQTVDQAARLVLEAFTHVDEKSSKLKISLGKVVEFEAGEVCRQFAAGRHLAALKRLMEQQYMDMILADTEYLLLAVDEADKCPIALTRLVRSITTHIQQIGVKRVRFLLAGVSPYFQAMVQEDSGINRFFYKTLNLQPMTQDESTELVTTKLLTVVRQAEAEGQKLGVDPTVIDRVVNLSGGHPHILQLLGSHLIENESDDPDGVIDSRDLVSALRTICYEDRARVYDAAIHTLEVYGHLDALRQLIDAAARSFPTRIEKGRALRHIGKESVDWLVTNNFLRPLDSTAYGLMDEFLRIRMLFDEETEDVEVSEQRMIAASAGERSPDDELVIDDQFPPGFGQYGEYGDDSEESSSSGDEESGEKEEHGGPAKN